MKKSEKSEYSKTFTNFDTAKKNAKLSIRDASSKKSHDRSRIIAFSQNMVINENGSISPKSEQSEDYESICSSPSPFSPMIRLNSPNAEGFRFDNFN